MATNNGKKTKETDPVTRAHEEAEKDISKDFDLSDPDPTDDLDEGELAQKDNSDEEAFEELEKPRPHPARGDAEGHKGSK